MATKEEKEAFSTLIEERIKKQNVPSIIEAILDHCEETGLEVEVAGTLINRALKIRLEDEAKALKFLILKPK